MRPYKLHNAPPITIELKTGIKVATKGGKTRPKRLDHFLVTERNRDSNNFIKIDEVMKALGDEKPTEIPIVLMSDLPEENFAIFRGMFVKGALTCGAVYGEEKASRYYKDGEMVEPYEVDCNQECPFWKKEQCGLSGTLYFRLHPDLPRSNSLGAMRTKGIHIMRRVRASLEILYKQSGGVLANIPLKIRLWEETKKTQDNQTRKIPMMAIEPMGSQIDFMQDVAKEVKRRAELFELMNGRPHQNLDEIAVVGSLAGVNSRDSVMQTMDEEAEELEEDITSLVVESQGEEAQITQRIKKALDGIPGAQANAMITRFTDSSTGQIDEKALLKQIEKYKERRRNV